MAFLMKIIDFFDKNIEISEFFYKKCVKFAYFNGFFNKNIEISEFFT